MNQNEIDLENIIEDIRHTHVYVEGDNTIVCIEDGVEFNERAFNCCFMGRAVTESDMKVNFDLFDEQQAEEKDGRRKRHTIKGRPAWDIVIDRLMPVRARVSMFGKPKIIENFGLNGAKINVLNTWRGTLLEPHTPFAMEDVSLWLDHIGRTMGDDTAIVLDWMAWIVQNCSEKVRWGLLIHSRQGIGKDTLVAPIHAIFGAHNTCEVDARAIDSSFNGFDKAKFIVLNELENDSKYSTYTKLKPKISGTGSGMIVINEKYKSPCWCENVSAWMVFTNEPDALPMESSDRRFHVIEGKQPVSVEDQEAYYAKLWHWYRKEDGFAKVFAYLLRRDVTAFNPAQPPPASEAKVNMQIAAMTAEGRWVESLMSVGSLANRTVVTTEEIEKLAMLDDAGTRLMLTGKKLRQGLDHAGWDQVGSHPFDGGRVETFKTTWWVKRGQPRHSVASLRERMFAEMPKGMLARLSKVASSKVAA